MTSQIITKHTQFSLKYGNCTAFYRLTPICTYPQVRNINVHVNIFNVGVDIINRLLYCMDIEAV